HFATAASPAPIQTFPRRDLTSSATSPPSPSSPAGEGESADGGEGGWSESGDREVYQIWSRATAVCSRRPARG
ncbi:Os04g0204300, partial [Oryza sativa Japonica Group]